MTASDAAGAVAALYGADPVARIEANTWLMAFSESSEAWDACRELVRAGPSPQARFFGANVLHTKVRKEMHALDDAARRGTFQALAELLVAVLREAAVDMLTLKRLCLALGAAAAQSPSLHAPLLSLSAELGASGGGVEATVVACELLAALPDELEHRLSGSAFDCVRPDMGAIRPHLPAVCEALTARSGDAGTPVRLAVLNCLRAWAAALPDTLHLRALVSIHRPLLDAVLRGLSDSRTVDAAAEVLCSACALDAVVLDAGPADVKLAASLAQWLLQLRPALAQGAEGDAWAVPLSRALGAFAACAATPLACVAGAPTEDGQSLQELVLFMLDCMELLSLAAVDNLVDMWVCLQDTPMAERMPPMRAPLFERLLAVMIRRVCWAAADDVDAPDSEDFEEWRVKTASEVFTCCLGALGVRSYLAIVSGALRGSAPSTAWSTDWRAIEAATFAVGAVHVEFKGKLRAPRSTAESFTSSGSESSDEEARAIDETLDAILGLVGPAVATATPAGALAVDHRLVTTVVSTLGTFGIWARARGDRVPLLIKVCLGAAAAVPTSASSPRRGLEAALAAANRPLPKGAVEAARLQLVGAEAFRNLCIHCAVHLTSAPTLTDLAAVIAPRLGGGGRLVAFDGAPLGTDMRGPLVEGLGRLAAKLATQDLATATAVLTDITAVPAAALQGLLVGPAVDDRAVSAAMALEVALISSAIRYCDAEPSVRPFSLPTSSNRATGDGSHSSPSAALIAVLGAVWPLLEAIPGACPSDPAASDAVIDLLTKAVLSAKGALSGQLSHVINISVASFATHRTSAALHLLRAVVEVHGPRAGEEIATAVGAFAADITASVTQRTTPLDIGAAADPSADADAHLVADLFDLVRALRRSQCPSLHPPLLATHPHVRAPLPLPRRPRHCRHTARSSLHPGYSRATKRSRAFWTAPPVASSTRSLCTRGRALASFASCWRRRRRRATKGRP